MTAEPDIADANLKVYLRPGTVRWYADRLAMLPPEPAVFAACEAAWRGGDVLDIGVGGGRTTPFVAPAARSYVGVDYSPAMVAMAQALHPTADLRQADVRDLSAFADAAFDFVLFSFNGLDSLSHADRALALAEIRRVLRPGGTYMFSGHNLDNADRRFGLADLLRAQVLRSPLATLKSFARIGVRVRNYLRSRQPYDPTQAYALLTDPGDDFAARHYYAGAAEVRRQLEAAGFEVLGVYDWAGRLMTAPADPDSPTLHYLARKPG